MQITTSDLIIAKLKAMRDEKLKAFSAKLLPNIPAERIIGVRIPHLRTFSKSLALESPHYLSVFLQDLPHFYLEENLLHAFCLEYIRDEQELFSSIECFLPHIDNWMVCDTFMPKLFKKQPASLLPKINIWLTSTHTYTVRFAIGLLLKFFLTNLFNVEYLDRVAKITVQEYYINMMIAWFFAEALVKQKDATLPFLQEKKLQAWVQNKAIQKAVESKRIDENFKSDLKKLKVLNV